VSFPAEAFQTGRIESPPEHQDSSSWMPGIADTYNFGSVECQQLIVKPSTRKRLIGERIENEAVIFDTDWRGFEPQPRETSYLYIPQLSALDWALESDSWAEYKIYNHSSLVRPDNFENACLWIDSDAGFDAHESDWTNHAHLFDQHPVSANSLFSSLITHNDDISKLAKKICFVESFYFSNGLMRESLAFRLIDLAKDYAMHPLEDENLCRQAAFSAVRKSVSMISANKVNAFVELLNNEYPINLKDVVLRSLINFFEVEPKDYADVTLLNSVQKVFDSELAVYSDDRVEGQSILAHSIELLSLINEQQFHLSVQVAKQQLPSWFIDYLNQSVELS